MIFMLKSWLSAARPRTLPLALASILMGSFMAASVDTFSWTIFLLAAFTTVLLQILSNFANDYGDTVNGIDTAQRTVATRAVQRGDITPQQMLRAIIISGILSFGSGCLLIFKALQNTDTPTILSFFGLGILAIIAAITYTVGKKPYGYAGLGDLSVLIFFGWVGVIGTYFLYTHTFAWDMFLPATSCGLLAVGVLNINNIRDIENDSQAGKNSVPVRLGRAKAVQYHWMLLWGAVLCSLVYVGLNFNSIKQLAFLITLPLIIKIGKGVQASQTPAETDPFLKKMALTTLLFVVSFGLGQMI
jgi:1,4-dihydroxy-2-naphthoate polyprenyltransferase